MMDDWMNDADMQEWLKDLGRKENRRETRISAIVKNVNPETILDHIRKKLSRIRRSEFIAYRKEIQKISKVDEAFNEYLEGMPDDTEGAKRYLRARIDTWLVIATRAGIKAENIDTTIAIVARKIGSPEPLPKLPRRPMRHISPNNKLMTALTTKEIINSGAVNLDVMPNDGITTYVVATYDIDEDMTPFNLTPFERTVMDAVCSIYRQATLDGDDKPVMTTTSIYKAMPGAGAKPTATVQAKIAAAFTRMRHIFVTLDASSELLKLKKIKPGERYTKETNMLLAEEHQYKRQNGTISIGWQLFQKPVVYEYAELTGQIVNVPAKVIQIEGVTKTGELDGIPFNLSENRRELLAYLLRRVAVIKNSHKRALEVASWKKNREAGKSWQEFMNQSPVILYKTAFSTAGIEITSRKIQKDCRDFCRLVFDYWKAIDYIPAYEELREGRAIRGLKIVL